MLQWYTIITFLAKLSNLTNKHSIFILNAIAILSEKSKHYPKIARPKLQL